MERQKKDLEKKQKTESDLQELQDKTSKIIRRLGYVPGARELSASLDRMFQIYISRRMCGNILASMKLVAGRPLKDAYKHQATHDHEYATEIENLVAQNFFIGCRKVILTDITYLYYGEARTTFYVCIFYDPYNKEPVGWATSQRMTVVDLVKPAYNMMIEKHGNEFKKNVPVFIHSDQGSQYMSTSFQQLLSDDAFVQSCSDRGNSLDNSPMESYFSRMKTILLPMVALTKNYATANELVCNFLYEYKYEKYQYSLGNMTPHEFYLYTMTGVVPMENYFGVNANRLQQLNALLELRKEQAEEAARRAREKAERDKAAGLTGTGKDPLDVVNRDAACLAKELNKLKDTIKRSEKQVAFVQEIIEDVVAAKNFVVNADAELKVALRDKKEWKNHPELSYIFKMKGMF